MISLSNCQQDCIIILKTKNAVTLVILAGKKTLKIINNLIDSKLKIKKSFFKQISTL